MRWAGSCILALENEPREVKTKVFWLHDFLKQEAKLPELLPNSGFELLDANRKTPQHWSQGTWGGRYAVDDVFVVPQADRGAHAVYFAGIKHAMTYAPRATLSLKQPISIEPNATYVLRARMKFRQSIEAGVLPGLFVSVSFKERDGGQKRTSVECSVSPGANWFDAAWFVETPAFAADMDVTFLLLEGVGEAWLDNVSFKRVP